MQTELREIREVLCNPADIIIAIDDQVAFNNATHCYICNYRLDRFGVGTMDKVRNRCHIFGKYKCAAHNECNLKLRIYPCKTKVPVVFHNLCSYDRHLIMSTLGKSGRASGKIGCIPNNMEKNR